MKELSISDINKNLKLYPLFFILFRSYAWASIFFLYFLKHLPIEQVLQLEAIYYLAVVVLEVPSGYFSDRIGRKPTLVIATVFQALTYALFFWGDNFAVLSLAQVCFAFSFAFVSGTDQSFYYESVKLTKHKNNYGQMEASLMKKSMWFRAFSQLMAGFLGIYAIEYGYGLSFVLSVMALLLVLQFKEVSVNKKSKVGFLSQIQLCFNYWKVPKLLWVTIFIFFFTICTHFPYEYFQKYIDLLDIFKNANFNETPLFTGAVASLAIFIASFFAGSSITLKNKIGFTNVIILTFILITLILFGMSYFLSSWVLFLILMRSIPSAISRSPIVAEISPLIKDSERATFMSINSLIGRFGYGMVLLGLSNFVNVEQTNWVTLSSLLKVGFYISVTGLVSLLVFKKIKKII